MRKFSGIFWLILCLAPSLEASQFGPVFPSHRFPTDRSFHLNTNFNYGAESSLWDDEAERQALGGTLTRLRLTINPEYQPSRQLSLGAYLNFDSLKLAGSGTQLTKSGFSDQYLFGEYRVVDEVGHSIGFGTVFKIPLYSVPDTLTGSAGELLLGDGQIDATLLVSGEYWPWPNFKLLGDLGFTFRTDEHASEIPFQFGGEYVSPRFNLGAYFFGNLSLNNDKATQNATAAQIQALSGGTNYVYATNPVLVGIELKGEYAFSHSWAATLSFQNSLYGKNSPYFINVAAGVSYRYFDPAVGGPRRAREVGIETDDSSQEFEGEIQEGQDESLQDEEDVEDY